VLPSLNVTRPRVWHADMTVRKLGRDPHVEAGAVAALPIMLELAEEPTVGCRAGIVELIGEVAKTGWRPVGPTRIGRAAGRERAA
jgi:hypothetical protein